MSTTTTITMPTTPLTNGRIDKIPKKQSKIVVLALPPSLLQRFGPKKEIISVATSPAPAVEVTPKLKMATSQEHNPESNSTPAPPQDLPSPTDPNKKKDPMTNGIKRSTPLPDSSSKPRGKPGPKKKPRLEDGTIDHTTKQPVISTANHKLGPKANTGFINANLRALDRSGSPCRRWQRNGFQLRSFTGHTWELSGWKGTAGSALADSTTDHSNKAGSMQDSSDQKPSESESATGSNAGDHQEKMDITTPAASSPPPMLPPTSTSIQA